MPINTYLFPSSPSLLLSWRSPAKFSILPPQGLAMAPRRKPCHSCTQLKKKCEESCVLAPLFSASQLDPDSFEKMKKVFGGDSRVREALGEIPGESRSDAVKSLKYEANKRLEDPIHGSLGVIEELQREKDSLFAQLELDGDGRSAMIAKLEADIDKLLGEKLKMVEENKKLREDLEFFYEKLEEENEKLKKENEKLKAAGATTVSSQPQEMPSASQRVLDRWESYLRDGVAIVELLKRDF